MTDPVVPVDMRKLVGANLVRLRTLQKLTQDQLSEKSGFTQAYISGLERGQRNPTVLTLYELALPLNTDIGAFFEPTRH
jgi:transcriptional regulator with XRE-family HTH domain